MVQTINTTHNISDESDGLPMPKRIWAVVSVGFALCMSVLDINIVNIVLPTLSHDFGTTGISWQSLFHCCLSPLWGR